MTVSQYRRTAAIVATLAVLLTIGIAYTAKAVLAEQAGTATVHTNFAGYATFNLPAPVNLATQVVQVTAGGTHLGGEDPSYATVNYAGMVDANTVRVRIIGWHANVVTGQAEFRYYSNADADLVYNVEPRTDVPLTVS